MSSSSQNRFGMGVIDQLVQDTLTTGYLSLEVEKQLRYLLQMTKYSQKDFEAFINLQHAALDGLIRQESREQMFSALSLSA
jgi:hypothetical protein